MSAINLSRNNLEGLQSFQGSEAYESLSREEQRVLNRYIVLQSSGNMTKQDLVTISEINDPSLGYDYGGVGKVSEAVTALSLDGIEVTFLITHRPYLFFSNPETSEFFFFKNLDVLKPYSADMDVLSINSGQWEHVDKDQLAEFFGKSENADKYPGLIKAHFIVVQFNQAQESIFQQREQVELLVKEESLGPKENGEKYFCERQKSCYCQMHAANAFLGYSAVKPNAIAQYIATRTDGFSHQHVENLAAGGYPSSNDAAAVLDIDNGIDLGMVIDYLHHLESEGELKVSISEIKVGKLSYSDQDGLQFIDDVTGELHQVDSAFLADHSRAILGTYQPLHAKAVRKNTDDTWTEVDSFKPNQSVHSDFRSKLIETIKVQKEANGDSTTLPCAFM